MTDGRIDIRYAAITNGREGCGFLPQVTENGRPQRSAWAGHGYEREAALALARELAGELAARYVGDWHVTIAEAEHA